MLSARYVIRHLMSGTTMLFVWVFVAILGWMLIASAVAVGAEHGLRRYHGEATHVFGTESEHQQSGE